jgi:pilus assembly protein CpaE
VIRPLFRDVVLNAGGVRSPGLLLELLHAATRVYLVCPQKFTALAEARRLLERVAPGVDVFQRMVLVVDEHHASINLSEEQMRNTLAIPFSVRLPPSRVELVNSLNVGRPLALEQPHGPYAQALARLCGEAWRAPQSTPVRLLTHAVTEVRRRIGGAG